MIPTLRCGALIAIEPRQKFLGLTLSLKMFHGSTWQTNIHLSFHSHSFDIWFYLLASLSTVQFINTRNSSLPLCRLGSCSPTSKKSNKPERTSPDGSEPEAESFWKGEGKGEGKSQTRSHFSERRLKHSSGIIGIGVLGWNGYIASGFDVPPKQMHKLQNIIPFDVIS